MYLSQGLGMKFKFIWEVQTKVIVTTIALINTFWNKWHFSSGLEGEHVPISRAG